MSITVSYETAKRLHAAGWDKTQMLMWWMPLDPETVIDREAYSADPVPAVIDDEDF